MPYGRNEKADRETQGMVTGAMPIQIDTCKRILVISPHLDDGVLSVGGIIERAVANRADVVVATAVTADAPPGAELSPFAVDLHEFWGLGPTPFARRRQEDAVSVSSLGGRVLHGGLLDALYRTDAAGVALYATRQAIFSPPSDRDSIDGALFRLLNGWMDETQPDLVLAPLAVGRHVDHVVTTNALRRLAEARPMKVALYEDMPYSTGLFPPLAPDSVEAALERTAWQVTGSQAISVALPAKLNAIAAYASQIADIFPNGLDFRSVLEDYMGRDGGFAERIWEVAA